MEHNSLSLSRQISKKNGYHNDFNKEYGEQYLVPIHSEELGDMR